MGKTREQIIDNIEENIKQNGQRDITGIKLQGVLKDMTENLAVNDDLQNYVDVDTIDLFLDALGTYMNGVWSRSFNENTGRHEFTFSPNPGFFYPDYLPEE